MQHDFNFSLISIVSMNLWSMNKSDFPDWTMLQICWLVLFFLTLKWSKIFQKIWTFLIERNVHFSYPTQRGRLINMPFLIWKTHVSIPYFVNGDRNVNVDYVTCFHIGIRVNFRPYGVRQFITSWIPSRGALIDSGDIKDEAVRSLPHKFSSATVAMN